LSSFSQTDTTKVRIKVPVAKLAIKDILKGDGCQLELKETQEKVIKLESRDVERVNHITLLEEKDKNNTFMLGKKDEQLATSQELSDKLHKELKGQKVTTFLWKLGAYAGLITTTYLLILK
jgi:hypothetical protein